MILPEAGPTQEEKKEIYRQGYEDPVFFLHFHLEHWFPDTIPWVHIGILAIVLERTDFILKHLPIGSEDLERLLKNFFWLEDPDDPFSRKHYIFRLGEVGGEKVIHLRKKRFTAIIMPRGFSKTTLLNGAVLYMVYYEIKKFIVYLSETSPHAEQQLENLKVEIETNQRLLAVFGELKPKQRTSEGKWQSGLVILKNKIAIVAKGRGSQVRGINIGGNRPDCILFDDVEDEESVSTMEQRQKARSWFWGTVVPALPRRDKSATICGLGTMLHNEALLVRLAKNRRFTAIKFGARDIDGNPLLGKLT